MILQMLPNQEPDSLVLFFTLHSSPKKEKIQL